jgi:hypothetical protein
VKNANPAMDKSGNSRRFLINSRWSVSAAVLPQRERQDPADAREAAASAGARALRVLFGPPFGGVRVGPARQVRHEEGEFEGVRVKSSKLTSRFQIEKFLKSTAIEVRFDNEVTERGRYSPRFIDEIADEIDVIEDKKDSLFSK